MMRGVYEVMYKLVALRSRTSFGFLSNSKKDFKILFENLNSCITKSHNNNNLKKLSAEIETSIIC